MTEWKAKIYALVATLLLLLGLMMMYTVLIPITDAFSSIKDVLVSLTMNIGFISAMFHIWRWALKFEK